MVDLSIPLNVRNNYSYRVRAANQQVLAAEAYYLSVLRKQQLKIETSLASLQAYQQRVDQWQLLMPGRGERGEALLAKQWRSGDISTTDYLLTLQQISEGLLAGIDLSADFQMARIQWLLDSGQLLTLFPVTSDLQDDKK